jgi:outer membrane protein assembly factor BamB
VAVGAFKERVEIWDVVMAKRVSGFPTVLDYGGTRLCLDAKGKRCFAGAFKRKGLAAYDAGTGDVLWTRPDIKAVQYIARASGERVFVGVDRGPAQVLAAETGKTVEKLNGVRRAYEDARGRVRFLDKRTPVVELASGKSFSVERSTFAILDVAIGPASLCLSEAGGPVRCFDLSGREMWRCQSPSGEHVISLFHASKTDGFFGVAFDYGDTGQLQLVRVGPNAKTNRVAVLTGAKADVCLDGEALLQSDGQMLAVSTGKRIRRIPLDEK